MTMNWARALPNDKDGQKLQEFPAPFPALARYNDDNGVSSSVISLHPNTSIVEFGVSGGQGAVIRWVSLTETAAVSPFGSVISSGVSANFDHFVPPNTYRRFVVPKETQGLGTAPMQIGSTFGLYQRVAAINAGTGASSVLISEF